MDDSILTSVKKYCGIDRDCTDFDTILLGHINGVLSILTQVGVGAQNGTYISDDSTTWGDITGNDPRLSMARSYVECKVKLIFDPPTISAVLESMKELIKEFEWRLNVAGDTTM